MKLKIDLREKRLIKLIQAFKNQFDFKKIDIEYPIGVQCWANTFRKGEGIAKHCHRDPRDPDAPRVDWTCTNLFIGGNPDLGTWFEGEKCDNNRGELMLFSSSVHHWVPPNNFDDVRITMAMDIHSWPKPKGATKNQYFEMR